MKDEELKLRLSINYYPKRERPPRSLVVAKKRKGEKTFFPLFFLKKKFFSKEAKEEIFSSLASFHRFILNISFGFIDS
jgi:hypothetical protein